MDLANMGGDWPYLLVGFLLVAAPIVGALVVARQVRQWHRRHQP